MPHPRHDCERRIGELHAAALYAAADARQLALDLCRIIDLVEDAIPPAIIAAHLRRLADGIEGVTGISHDG